MVSERIDFCLLQAILDVLRFERPRVVRRAGRRPPRAAQIEPATVPRMVAGLALSHDPSNTTEVFGKAINKIETFARVKGMAV